MIATKWAKTVKVAKHKAKASDEVSSLNLLDRTHFGTYWHQGAMELGNQAHILQLTSNGDILCVQFEGAAVNLEFRNEMEERTP